MKKACLHESYEPFGRKCISCHEWKKECLLSRKRPAPRPKRGKEKAKPLGQPESDGEGKKVEIVSPAKSLGLLSLLKKTFARKSQDDGPDKSQTEGGTSPYSPYSRKVKNLLARTRPAVVPPPLTHPMGDYQRYCNSVIDSDYQDVETATLPFRSSTSLRSYNTFGSTSDKSAAEVQALDFELGLMCQK